MVVSEGPKKGKTAGCHATREKAAAQVRALYANTKGEYTHMSVGPKVSKLIRLAQIQVKPYVAMRGGKVVPVVGYQRTIDPLKAIDFADYRKDPAVKLKVDPVGMRAALAAAGVTVGPKTKIKLRLWDAGEGTYGQTQKIGPDEYRVAVRVKPGKGDKESHQYVINNSLVHELRHVTQFQMNPHQNESYEQNSYEVEGRYYGRLADPTGLKDTGPAGPAKGKGVWGLVPA